MARMVALMRRGVLHPTTCEIFVEQGCTLQEFYLLYDQIFNVFFLDMWAPELGRAQSEARALFHPQGRRLQSLCSPAAARYLMCI